MKFATKIFIYIFLSTALIIGGLSASTHYWLLNYHMKNSISHAKEIAMLLSLKSEEYILRNDLIDLYKLFRSILEVDSFIAYIFVEKDDEVLAHTFEKGMPRGLLNLGPFDDPSKIDILPIEDNQNNLIYHFRVRVGSPPHSTIHLGFSDQKIRAALGEHRNILLLIGLLSLAVIPFCLALFLSRFVSKPLTALRVGVKRIGSGELDYRLDLPTGDEIEHLVNDINSMAEKLEILRNGLEEEIAERVQAEKSLADQSELLNNILQNVPHHIFWKDRNSVYIGCNKTFAESAGLASPSDVAGKTDYDLPWERSKADYYRTLDQDVMYNATPIYEIEDEFIGADGRAKSVIMSLVPLKYPDGQVFGVMGIYYDITERKKMEETIKQNQKMEAIGTLAGGIAHDFNNILGSIIGYTELAEGNLDRKSPVRDDLLMVLSSANRAKELIRQILTFSRKNKEERSPIKFSAVVKEEMKLLRSTLPTTIEIRQHIADKDGMVNSDPTQLYQIVMNLCTNAAHAMEGAGILELSLSDLTVTPEDARKIYNDITPGPFIKLTVSDTGTGIEPAVIHRIFEPFFTTKGKDKGTGMGLAVVHGIVKDLGGDIQVKSQPGMGTEFTVILPRVIQRFEAKAAPAPEMPTGKDRVLFVDDDPNLLDLGKKVLISLGYSVTAMNSSLDALNAYRHSPDSFDIVITDHTMPHLTGFDMSRQILEINPLARILLCTGYSDSLTPEKVAAAGIKTLLFKPINRKELANAIRKVLDG